MCWHCGSTDHTRQNCPKYKNERQSNGGKHVRGKYEEANAKPGGKPRLAPLQEPDLLLTEDEDEADESVNTTAGAPKVNLWALQCAHEPAAPKQDGCITCAPVMPTMAPQVPDVLSPNSFEALFSDLIDEEEKTLVASLGEWAKVLPKRKQTRKAAQKSEREHNEWLLAVEEKKKLVSSELQDLGPDEELVLVDSGCGNHACHPTRHFRQFQMRPSAGSKAGQVFVTANENKIANEGEKVVRFKTREGEQCQVTVQCANVAMPIFSTRKLGRTHRSVFADEHQDRGYLEHRTTGARTHFFSKDGVYFLRIKLTPEVPEVQQPKRGFGRPV